MKRQWFIAGIATTIVMGMATGCSSGNSTSNSNNGTQTPTGSQGSAASDAKDTFSMSFIDDGHGFDPGLFSWEMYQDGVGIFEGLVHTGPNGKPTAGIATSWESSKNNTVWTFHLRKDAKFTNGDPVTAQSFVYAMQRAVSPTLSVATKAASVPLGDVPILNMMDVRTGAKPASALGVKAPDDYTVEITLDRPDANMLQDICLPTSDWMVPLDQKVVENMKPSDWTNPSKIVSDGPYMLKTYKAATEGTLVPNPNYYTKVTMKKINLFYGNSQTLDQLVAFKNGSLDAGLIQPEQVAAAQNDSSLKSQLNMWDTSAQYSYVPLPSKNTALQNKNIRLAFEMAIDKNAICQGVLKGTASPAYGYFTPNWLDPWMADNKVDYNVDKAKQLLANAGYPDGKGFPTVIILVGSTTDHVAEAIQQMWEQNLGVKVQLQAEEWGQFVTDMKKQLPANEVGWLNSSTNAKYPQQMLPTTPSSWLINHTDLAKGYMNPSAYSGWLKIDNNQDLDAAKKENQEYPIFQQNLPKDYLDTLNLGVEAYQKQDDSLMKQYFTQMEQNAYTIPIYTPKQPILLRKDVQGYYPNKFLLIDPPVWLNYITKSN
ncbi:peptide ABC transporter substrate-binding protein [Alicyclobacillus dauci]|uniref:Peptide ABC transporter substrate-binding protein n=1 Tax=Alicyclobacillus dauci TaxID=1475485 RepID=A0ABY6YYD3_9BACL|nr:peptide ABC transporter substrate-binding protein [Alicyclobacillus dauci]WAH35581.1 peptide ABC transporter substrate-binding protein [Alicyclobacillus dauci]